MMIKLTAILLLIFFNFYLSFNFAQEIEQIPENQPNDLKNMYFEIFLDKQTWRMGVNSNNGRYDHYYAGHTQPPEWVVDALEQGGTASGSEDDSPPTTRPHGFKYLSITKDLTNGEWQLDLDKRDYYYGTGKVNAWIVDTIAGRVTSESGNENFNWAPAVEVNEEQAKPVFTGSDLELFKKKILSEMNKYRRKHCSPSLTLDDTLTKYAQKWAVKLSKLPTVKHYTGDAEKALGVRRVGQNIFWENSNLTPTSAAELAPELWYSEIHDYKSYSNPDPKCERQEKHCVTGHFTQLVWAETSKVGVGYYKGFVVADYIAAGNNMSNNMNKFIANVKNPGSCARRRRDHKETVKRLLRALKRELSFN